MCSFSLKVSEAGEVHKERRSLWTFLGFWEKKYLTQELFCGCFVCLFVFNKLGAVKTGCKLTQVVLFTLTNRHGKQKFHRTEFRNIQEIMPLMLPLLLVWQLLNLRGSITTLLPYSGSLSWTLMLSSYRTWKQNQSQVVMNLWKMSSFVIL